MALRLDNVRSTDGELYAFVHENANTGLKRGLFWNLALKCPSVTWEQEQWSTSFLCDWATWPVRRWKDLAGMTRRDLVHPEMLEVSFYLGEHHDAKVIDLRLKDSSRPNFRVELQGTVNVTGFGELDATNIPFSVQGEVTFKGLIVVPDNLFPKPTTTAEVKTLSEHFLDLDGFTEPRWDRFRFVFEPSENAV